MSNVREDIKDLPLEQTRKKFKIRNETRGNRNGRVNGLSGIPAIVAEIGRAMSKEEFGEAVAI